MEHSETFYQNPAGNQSCPAKAGRQPEANIASSSVMAARSVWSERRSRVIEPRNNDRVGAFVVRQAGAAWTHRDGLVWTSDRGLRAGQRRGGFSGNLGDPVDSSIDPRKKDGTGLPTSRHRQRPCKLEVSETMPGMLVRAGRRKPSAARWETGSLSPFIVPMENRRTGPLEPGSREGRGLGQETVVKEHESNKDTGPT
jgi:hypothetical protein